MLFTCCVIWVGLCHQGFARVCVCQFLWDSDGRLWESGRSSTRWEAVWRPVARGSPSFRGYTFLPTHLCKSLLRSRSYSLGGGEAVVSSPAYPRLPLAPGTVTLQQLRSPRKPQRPSRIFPCCFRRAQQSLSEERHPRAISLQETFS